MLLLDEGKKKLFGTEIQSQIQNFQVLGDN